MLTTTVWICFVMLSVSLLLSFVRLVIGPTLPDRVVALELVTAIVVAMIALQTVATGVSSFLDVAVVSALMAFLAAVAFARYLERRGLRDD